MTRTRIVAMAIIAVFSAASQPASSQQPPTQASAVAAIKAEGLRRAQAPLMAVVWQAARDEKDPAAREGLTVALALTETRRSQCLGVV